MTKDFLKISTTILFVGAVVFGILAFHFSRPHVEPVNTTPIPRRPAITAPDVSQFPDKGK
jgi:hypothetical protein